MLTNFGMELLTDPRPATQLRHVGLRPNFVEEDEASRIKPALIFLPLLASPGDHGPVSIHPFCESPQILARVRGSRPPFVRLGEDSRLGAQDYAAGFATQFS